MNVAATSPSEITTWPVVTSGVRPFVISGSTVSDDPVGVFVIPSRQRYYWTAEWQLQEAVSLDEYERGDFVEFVDPGAALEWLRSDDDADV